MTWAHASLLAALFALSACGEANETAPAADTATQTEEVSSEPAVRDVQYFLDHPDELEELYSECRNNPGVLGDTPECINVLDARSEARRRAMREELRGPE